MLIVSIKIFCMIFVAIKYLIHKLSLVSAFSRYCNTLDFFLYKSLTNVYFLM